MQLLVLVAAVVSAVTTPAPTDAVLPTRGVPVAEATVRPEPVVHRQCDPRWASARIRTATLCRSGCAIFALRRAAAAIGLEYEPLDFLALLQEHQVFNGANEVIWGNLTEALPLVATRVRGPISIAEVTEHLRNNRQVILEVPGSRSRHWVHAAQVIGDDIVVDDSRDGARVSLQERYGNNVTGHAIIERLPVTS